MKVYIYKPRRWTDLDNLKEAIQRLGHEVVYFNNKQISKTIHKDPVPKILCWGWSFSYERPSTILNSRIMGNKLKELLKLKEKKINVPTIYVPSEVPGHTIWGGGVSMPAHGSLLARSFRHKSAKDLLTASGGNFYTRWEPIKDEFRIHVFNDGTKDHPKYVSIRAGLKVKAAPDAHPWIRSLDLGWEFDYGQICQENISKDIRNVAKEAVKALGYDFGAVDVGVRPDGKIVVFEVNSAPGLRNPNTADAYAKHILSRF